MKENSEIRDGGSATLYTILKHIICFFAFD